MKKILANLQGYYKEIVIGPLFKLLEAVLELFVPIVVANIIDKGIALGDRGYILRNGLLLFLLALLGMGTAMVCQYYAIRVSGHFGSRLRAQTYRHVLSLSGSNLTETDSATLITLLTNDVQQIQTGVNMAIRLATRAPFLAIGSIAMALLLNLKIGLIFLVSTPMILFILYAIMKSTLPSYEGIQKEQDKLSALASENLSGIRVIRAFGRQKQAAESVDKVSSKLTSMIIRVGKISMTLNPLTTLVIHIAIAAIIFFGARLSSLGDIAPGKIIALVSYMNQTLLALIVIANIIVLFTRSLASARRVAALLDMEPSIALCGKGIDGTPKGDAVAFSAVSFSYHQGAEPVLADITFTIEAGQTVGIIGGTGSGKSTLINLIMRYFDANKGETCIFGSDIKEYRPQALRSAIGLVPQKAVLFAGSVRYNLQMAAKAAVSDEELWHALDVAQASDFVKALPGGLDALIEEGGRNLSGGQRQRLTIARALAGQPKLLILDDSSSALDYATDKALHSALMLEKARNPALTVLIISQRTASIRHADNILVLDKGRLTGQGTHAELLQGNLVYREICDSQGILAGNPVGKETRQ